MCARRTAGTLSYGLRKRVELARAIALKPKLILLDEPMAGMNLEEKEDMARFIVDLNEEWGMTVLMIEHDMGVVMDISPPRHGAGFRPQDRRGPAGGGAGRPACAARLSGRGRRGRARRRPRPTA